jgi:hypothetical protein
VLADEGFGIGGGALEGGDRFGAADVAEGNGDVAEESAAFGTEDGGTGEAGAEGGVVEGEQIVERGGVEVVASVRGKESGLGGEPVPGARGEAIVTPVDAVADEGAQVLGDGSLELDGQVRDATTGIEGEGRGERVGGAGVEAAGALAAEISRGWVGGEFGLGQDFSEEEPVPEIAGHEVGVASDETDAGALGEIPFEDGAGVDIPEGSVGRGGGGVEPCGEFGKARREDVVVIGMAGVTGEDPVGFAGG